MVRPETNYRYFGSVSSFPFRRPLSSRPALGLATAASRFSLFFILFLFFVLFFHPVGATLLFFSRLPCFSHPCVFAWAHSLRRMTRGRKKEQVVPFAIV